MNSKLKSRVPEDLAFIQATYLTTDDWELQRKISPHPDSIVRITKDLYEMSNILSYLSHQDFVSQEMALELSKMSRDIWQRLKSVVISINRNDSTKNVKSRCKPQKRAASMLPTTENNPRAKE